MFRDKKFQKGKNASCFILIWLTCAFANDCSKSFKINSEYFNKRLTGHSIAEIKVPNQHMCARECIYTSMCKSMDYFHGTCKLNDADSKSVFLGEFQVRLGAIFSDVSDWPLLIAGACGQQPCSESQKCIPVNDGYKCEELAITDCSDVRLYFPSAISGKHIIKLWQSHELLTVVCDMETDGGGWTVLQSRFDGSVDFYKESTEYVNGFGNQDTEFWLGLKYLHEMTSQGKNELRLDLTAADGTTVYETFRNFNIDAGPEYTIHFDPGFGTAGDGYSNFGMSYTMVCILPQ